MTPESGPNTGRLNAAPLYLLDSDTCIRFLNGKAPGVRKKMSAIKRSQIRVCSLVKMEVFAAALQSDNSRRALERQREFFAMFESMPFDDAAAQLAGRIKSRLGADSQLLGPTDMLTAAIALAGGMKVVTSRTKEFGRVPGLETEDWEK